MYIEQDAAQASFDLTDKIAIVTGAGRGIGRACALRLADLGADVVLTSRTRAELDAVAAEIESRGRAAWVVPADVADFGACDDLVAQTMTAFGRVDVLINNAGMGGPQTVADADPVEWANVVALNLIGPFNMSRAVLPHMIAGDGGRIVMIGSGLGHNPVAGLSAYGSSKAGMSHFVKILADEVWSHGVDVNEVIPGPVATQLTEGLAEVGKAPAGLPSERVKLPEEVAELVCWLVRQRAGGPTGQIFSLARRAL